jgi:PAS domain S-box-containing protein
MVASKWLNGIDVNITVCDAEGIIIYMNEKAVDEFGNKGGKKLLGKNILDCHPEPARSKIEELLKTKRSNCYTIEKENVKKMVMQKPWYEGDTYKGFVEIVSEIPFVIPHFLRT